MWGLRPHRLAKAKPPLLEKAEELVPTTAVLEAQDVQSTPFSHSIFLSTSNQTSVTEAAASLGFCGSSRGRRAIEVSLIV